MANYEPAGNASEASVKVLNKVVVIQVRSAPGTLGIRGVEDRRDSGENLEHGSSGDLGRVLGARIVKAKDGWIVFWVLSTSARNALGFEASYLQGASAAVVVLESSDRRTVHSSTELLRAICKLFSIPVMLVVGGNVNEGMMGIGSTREFANLASKVVSFARIGSATVHAS